MDTDILTGTTHNTKSVYTPALVDEQIRALRARIQKDKDTALLLELVREQLHQMEGYSKDE